MSGGSFNYAYQKVYDFADELRNKIDENSKPDSYGEVRYGYDGQTIFRLRQIEEMARKTAALMKEAEWLYSGDTGPETFAARLDLPDLICQVLKCGRSRNER